MNNPFSLNSLTRNKSLETHPLALTPVEIKYESSEKQISLLVNPFTLPPNDPELYHHREIERLEESKYRHTLNDYPIQERHLVNQPKSILSDIRKDTSDYEGKLPAVGSRRNLSSKKETIKEFIQRKREILLVKKNIENKKAKYNELEEDIARKEDKHKANIKKLEDNKGRVAKYEEQLKIEADNKAKLAEDKAADRNEKQKILKNLQDEIESLRAKVDRMVEEVKNLEDYKQFVDELIPTENNYSIFLTEGASSIDHYAKKLEEGINSLETTNLFQIQQAQEDEQELEILKHKNLLTKQHEMKKCADMKATVSNLEVQKQILEEKNKRIRSAEEIETPVDEVSSKRVYEEIALLYQECVGDLGNEPKELDMLESI